MLFLGFVIAAVGFSVYVFVKVAAVPSAAQPPVLSESPARVYGFVEPAGREVFVCPPMARRVTRIWVGEGDRVEVGQTICSLENSVELRDVALASARVRSYEKAVEISRDLRDRARDLYAESATAEVDYTQSRLRAELDSVNLRVAIEEIGRAEAVLERLDMKSPINGVVYKLDVRLGETLKAGDSSEDCPIVLGAEDLWVRLYVETFWTDRVAIGTVYTIYDSETAESIGTAKVIYKAPYLTRRDFRTEDARERFDTGYQEVVLELATEKQRVPIGLSVVADLAN
jgi:multidrug efflux pump subunit AcrA (membrane-fusion protein)